MKRTLVGIFSILLIGATITSCVKKQEVTDQDAITFLGYALNNGADGLAKQAIDFAANLDYIIPYAPCGAKIDTTTYYKTTGIQACDYTFVRHFEKICGSDTTISCTGNNSGTYESPQIKVNGQDSYTYNANGVTSNASQYKIDGSSTGSGVLSTKGSFSKTYNVDWTIQHNGVVIQKYNRKINSGTGSFTINCKVVNGKSYSFTGTITYNGDYTATVTMNGKTYTIQLYQ